MPRFLYYAGTLRDPRPKTISDEGVSSAESRVESPRTKRGVSTIQNVERDTLATLKSHGNMVSRPAHSLFSQLL
jgi:hypothetical protein